MFNLKGKEIKNITINGKPVSKVTCRGQVIWPSGAPIDLFNLLLENGASLLTENNEEMEVEH